MTAILTGYDGATYAVGDRVEIHPGTDQWMMGARYGVVVRTSLTPKDRVHVELDAIPGRTFAGSEDTFRPILPRREIPFRFALASALRDLRGIETPNLTIVERNRAIRANAQTVARSIRDRQLGL